MLWLHGGGYVIGTPEMDDRACIEFARSLGLIVVSVDYRLAPAHPFPAALDDAWAAFNWMTNHSQKLALDPTRIAIGGASAGGGLAAALAQMACDRGGIQPTFQLLVYPMLDERTVLWEDIQDKDFLVWPRSSNRFGWESYLGLICGEDRVPSYAVPARREDLSGLPRPGSASARWTCSTTRMLTTRRDCRIQGFRSRLKWYPVRFTGLMCSGRARLWPRHSGKRRWRH